MIKTGFIGAGTTGTALAVRLSQKGWPVVAVSSRTLSSAQKLAGLVPNCQACHTAQELADAANTIDYEILTSIGSRVAREDI